ncbi:PKD domain-containing protein [Methanospirillum lacunae]|nr:PKD domain-containing protein [Methanospirillum lacunae]
MMKIWRYLPYMTVILLCLCGTAVIAELTLTTGTPAVQSDTVNPAAQSDASGISIMAAASDPDAYTLKNTLTLGSVQYILTRDQCGGSKKQITTGKLKRVHPKVYDNGVVYEEWNAGSSQVGKYDFSTGSSGIVNPSSQQQTYPDGSNRMIAYEQDASPGTSIKNIFVYDTQSQTSFQVSPSTSNQNQPAISGRYVVWQDWSSGNADIALADLNSRKVDLNSGKYDVNSNKVNLICNDLGDQSKPDISGNYVVWEDWRNGNADVYMYDISAEKEYQLTSDSSDQKNPKISGNIVVWEDTRNGGSDIYGMDLRNLHEVRLSGTGNAYSPDVSGVLVAWEDRSGSNADIMLLDLITGRIYNLGNDQFDQKAPSIYGDYVAWEDYSSGNPNIYVMQLSGSGISTGTGRTPSGNYYFYGAAYRAGNPIPLGSTITAMVDGESTARSSFTLDKDGAYGSKDGKYFNIPIYSDDVGKKLTFYVDGAPADNSIVITTAGGTQMLDLNVSGTTSIISSPVQGTQTGKYQFYGAITNAGTAIPVGSTITAMVEGSTDVRGSFTVDKDGAYGAQGSKYFDVPVYSGDVGKKLTFYVDGVPIDQTLVIGKDGGIQSLDLSSSYGSRVNSYQFSGNAKLNSQNAPSGTTLYALIDGRVRGQASVYTTGQYSGLNVPVYSPDVGKYITFAATYNGITYSSGQQVQVSSRSSGGVGLMSVGTVSAESVISQNLDLSFTSSSSTLNQYVLSGTALIGNQYASSGTIITALVGNVGRAQTTVSSPGQYSGLTVPIYSSDAGQYMTFTASYNGATYTTSQQYLVGSTGTSTGTNTGTGGVSLMSLGSTGGVSAEGTITQRLDLTFSSSSSPSQSKYCFYGMATIGGSPLDNGRIIYAVVDGQARGQITVSSAGQYGSANGPYLEVPIYQGDVGKKISFQTDTGSEADQTQLIVNGLILPKNLNFSTQPVGYVEFTATPVQGSAPLSVKFLDKSTGNPKSHYWDFGDGTTSTDSNPVHVYQHDGLYSVGEVVGYWNGQSKTAVKQNYIAVGAVTPPSAQIGLNPGWNFISTPKMLVDGMNSAKGVFGRIDVGGHSIFSYNPRAKTWSTVTADMTIKPLDAFWIYSTKKDALNLYFADDALQIPQTKKLVKGWNTFGVTNLNTISAYNTLLSIRDKWVYVIGYDSASQRFQNTIMNVPDSSQGSLYPGYGYWIYMSDDGDLAAAGI